MFSVSSLWEGDAVPRPRGIGQTTEDRWLALLRGGATTAQIASRSRRYSLRRVQIGISAARQREEAKKRALLRPVHEPRLVPFYPIRPLTPLSECPHYGPIKRGSVLYCEVCGQSGMDHHKSIVRDPRYDPPLEPRVPDPPGPVLTRREKRLRKFGWLADVRVNIGASQDGAVSYDERTARFHENLSSICYN